MEDEFSTDLGKILNYGCVVHYDGDMLSCYGSQGSYTALWGF